MPKATRNKEKDPEGRMPLTEHLRELRNRLGISVAAVLVITIVALFFAKDIMDVLTDPLPECDEVNDTQRAAEECATLTQQGLTSPFATYFRVSLLVGLIAASPVWLYQAWAFIAPGLHKNEKKYTRAVVGVGVPLFLAGVYFAYWLLPRAIPVLLSFSADGVENLVTVEELLDITVRMALAFGLSFELPLLLVLLNFGGVVSGKRMVSWWRWMVVGIAIFAAAITPTDMMSMIALQVPVTGLYFIACGIALLNDRRRGRRDRDAELSDEEASELDLTPSTIEPVERVTAAGGDDVRSSRLNGFDDAT
ncbi:twin-arginine translocase subunit TatC [Streptomyces litchfieldiae]|uniref:Sec-independent protein translocase protein TatC n=1 Tax=Streptomyces litchfieldiae TaxID=3075543 RepID=A0ABU2MVI5_9ACTN|nr:twin-arginine translocase subunit TatC [Streptomyces sp. DSM 44938]MDT0345662.1 twin-arginine translocase subunit TatC [Streptomyces sp. DSM 44938]